MPSSTLGQSRAALALRQNPLPPLRKLAIEETEVLVVIHGKVASYYLKQMAQEAVIPLLEGRKLDNRVAVVPEVATY